MDFFTQMKDVYIKKLYGDLYKYCDAIIENALAIEEIPNGFSRSQIKDRKFKGAVNFKLPISRLKKSDNKLIKHPFYNFGKKAAHI